MIFLIIRRRYQQYAIVEADSAQQLTDQLNAELIRLRDKKPIVTFEGLIARIQYMESETVPETLAEEYEVQGVNLTCEDCPYFCPMIKADGTRDLRAKWGGCHLTEGRIAKKSSRACDELFHKLTSGEVRLCVSTE